MNLKERALKVLKKNKSHELLIKLENLIRVTDEFVSQYVNSFNERESVLFSDIIEKNEKFLKDLKDLYSSS